MPITITQTHRDLETKYPYEINLIEITPTSGTLVFCPRDGTKYLLHFSELHLRQSGEAGHAPYSSLVSLSRKANKYASAAFDHTPHPIYLAEKLCIDDHRTAQQVERALRFLFNAEDIGPFSEDR